MRAEKHPVIFCQARHDRALLVLASATGILPWPNGGTCDCWASLRAVQAALGTVHVISPQLLTGLLQVRWVWLGGVGVVQEGLRLPLHWVSREAPGNTRLWSREGWEEVVKRVGMRGA